ncbi:MAG: tetratricopeptide repeat protein [Bryobacteraceae bacterium]|nr:tetratricopeptide repeat protein [Bryobacteraceae bacterium]
MGRRWVLLLGTTLAAVSTAALALNLWVPSWACRLWLCPESVQLSEARRLMLAGTPEGVRQAVVLYRSLVRRNPSSPYRWCDLAEAHLAARDPDQARAAFAQAERAGPGIPQTLLRAASFYLRQGAYQDALPRMSRILALTPAYDGLIFSYYDKMGIDFSDVLRVGIPAEARPAQSYFQYLLSNASAQQSTQAWEWLGSLGFQSGELAGAFASRLIRDGQASRALTVWAAYVGPGEEGYPLRNLIYNGDFERPVLSSPFDWRITPAGGAAASLEQYGGNCGRQCLHIEFRGTDNLTYEHVSQLVFVKPGRYRFQANLRAESITTDQGVGFRIRDYENPSRLDWTTERLLGSTGWRRVEVEFPVSPPARLLAVQVFREPSWKFDNQISGSVWIDCVRLEPVTP